MVASKLRDNILKIEVEQTKLYSENIKQYIDDINGFVSEYKDSSSILIDMKSVTYIDSCGVGLILHLHKVFDIIDIYIINVTPAIRAMISDVLKLSFIKYVNHEDECV